MYECLAIRENSTHAKYLPRFGNDFFGCSIQSGRGFAELLSSGFVSIENASNGSRGKSGEDLTVAAASGDFSARQIPGKPPFPVPQPQAIFRQK
jgi:hypothetical protein